MSQRRLRFVRVVAGLDASGSVHIYYGDCYVGCINPRASHWSVWLHELALGEYATLGAARAAVEAWYYGPDCTGATTPDPGDHEEENGRWWAVQGSNL